MTALPPSSTTISINFKQAEIMAMDSFLDIMRKQFLRIVTDKTENNITEDEKRKFTYKLNQVNHLIELLKPTSHN